MDKSVFFHRLGVAHIDEGQFHVFVRSDNGNIEHYFPDEDNTVMFGPEDLGGNFDTDPIAAFHQSPHGSDLHLIGRSGSQIIDWTWPSVSLTAGLLGAPTVVILPGLCVADPEVISSSGRLDVYAPGLDGPIRHWGLLSEVEEWSGAEVLTGDVALSRPCVVSRKPGSLDVFAVDNDNLGLRHWFIKDGRWTSEARSSTPVGQQLGGRPTAVSYEEERLDVFVVRNDGVPVHWGFNGRWFDEEVRLDPVSGGLLPDIQLVTSNIKQLTLVGRSVPTAERPSHLVQFDFEAPDRWNGPKDLDVCEFPVTAWCRGDDHLDLLSRNTDGSFSHHVYFHTTEHSIDGRLAWEGDVFFLPLEELPAPPTTFTPAAVSPDLLAIRPDDLVLLGVAWNESAHVEAGSPNELVAGSGAKLAVTLPPQHIAEEVVAAEGHVNPPTDPQLTGGFPVWNASPAGPSRVVVDLDEGTRVPLTVAGVLDALRRGTLVSAANLTDSGTQLELPFRMLMTPVAEGGKDITLDHPAEAVVGPSGGVGLWNSRVGLANADRAAPAGLLFQPLSVDGTDPFRTSLTGPSRAQIFAQPPTARIDRLRLSALGATFSAFGSWPTFEWDHVATLGRDNRVRTATKGVLYPFGNQAVYVETSERHLEPSADGAIAHLRKRRTLVITEPVRDTATDLLSARAFPFSSVRFDRALYDLGDEPGFHPTDLPVPGSEQLAQNKEQLEAMADEARKNLHQEMGPDPDTPVEALAFDPDLSDPDTSAAASAFVDAHVGLQRIADKLAALARGLDPVPVWFVPRDSTGEIKFPVTLTGTQGELHISLPVVFVADINQPAGLLTEAFHSLTDLKILGEVETAYREVGDGNVALDGARIDMLRAQPQKPADVPEVRRLHIVGESRDGVFAARLGSVPLPGETKPPADRWAFEMALPELRTLIGHVQGAPDAAQTLRVALSTELLQGAPEPKLLFLAPQGVDPIVAEFSRNTARSGGLMAPDLSIDGIARAHGPVKAPSATDITGGDFDPANFLRHSASLFGFSLADLIDKTKLKAPPGVLSAIQDGQPPHVSMKWSDVTLTTTKGQFVTNDLSKLTLDVEIGPAGQKVVCAVDQIALAFPDRDESMLLEVTIEQVIFSQEGGAAPTLKVTGVSAKFFGFLKLLEDLQNAVKLTGAEPSIHASDRGLLAVFDLPVPDLTTGGFQLTGLTFHSSIDVPFDGRPVTIEIAFASREDPFNVSILALGGGGYVDIVIDVGGLRRLEIALEFGASIEVDFKVAVGEVHAMGGIRVVYDKEEKPSFAGYLRFGGMVEVLGLVSVSVELLVTLTYEDKRNAMVGQATLVLELDLLLVSESVELDSGEWVLNGDAPASPATPPAPPPPGPVDPSPLGPGPLDPAPLDPAPLDPVLLAAEPLVAAGRVVPRLVDPDAFRRYREAFDAAAVP